MGFDRSYVLNDFQIVVNKAIVLFLDTYGLNFYDI